jgi:5-methylcytosine-specific restriction enzyme subunit McrC
MKIKEAICLFEFDCVMVSKVDEEEAGIHQISERAFKYLKKLCLDETSDTKFLKLKSYQAKEVIQFQNYAGVITTPDGTQVEVLPKIAKYGADKESSIIDARSSLLNMLSELGHFRHIQTSSSNIKKQKMPLLEIYIGQFLNSVAELIRRGLKSSYCAQSGNLLYLRGKLKVSEQIKRNSVNKHKFAVEYDEYLPDIYENRLVKTAISKVLSMTRTNESQKLARELLFAFDGVSLLEIPKSNAKKIALQRDMEHYKTPVIWSNLILTGHSPLTMSGEANAFSLLFPLEAVFENYVAKTLNKLVKSPLHLKIQAATKSLVSYNAKPMFRLKPDLLISCNGEDQIVLDTKWKLIDLAKDNGTDKFQLSQADFYQMFAYGHKYLGGAGELILIYPKTDRFYKPVPYSFDFDEGLKLWVVPFDIKDGIRDSNRFDLKVVKSVWELS